MVGSTLARRAPSLSRMLVTFPDKCIRLCLQVSIPRKRGFKARAGAVQRRGPGAPRPVIYSCILDRGRHRASGFVTLNHRGPRLMDIEWSRNGKVRFCPVHPPFLFNILAQKCVQISAAAAKLHKGASKIGHPIRHYPVPDDDGGGGGNCKSS